MATTFDLVIQWGILWAMIFAMGVIPFAISLRVCWVCTFWRRQLAVVLAIVTGAIFLLEIYGSILGGTLTGLIWVISFPFVSIALVTLYVTEKFSRSRTRSESHDVSHGGDEPIRKTFFNLEKK